MPADVVSLAREVKLIRSGLPLNELIERSKLVDRLNKQFGDVKNDVKKFERVSKGAADEAEKATKNVNRYQREFQKAKDQITKDVKRAYKEIDKATKPLQKAYEKLDKGVQRVTKGLDKFASAASLGFGIAGVAISFLALWASERNQVAFDRSVNIFEIQAAKQGSFNQLIQNRFKKLRDDFDAYKKKAEKTFDYQSQDLKSARRVADEARKMANDITYEARVKIKRLNDIVAEAKSNASKALVQNTTINNTLKTVEIKATKAATEASTARAGVKLVDTKATNAQQDATQAKIGVKLVDSKAVTALTTAQQLPAKIPILAQPAINNAIAPIKATNTIQDGEIAALKNNVRAIQNVPKTNTGTSTGTGTNEATVNQALVNRYVNNSISGMGIFPRLTAAQITADTALARATAALNKPEIDPIGRNALALGTNNSAKIDKLNQDIQQLKAPNLLEPRIQAVETKTREQEKVNQEANQKLDLQRSQLEQLLVVTGGLALMGPKIDNLPGTTAAAVAAQPCNGRGCGGRTAARVDGIDDRLKDMDSRLNSFNTAANAGQLAMLRKIDVTTTGNAAKLGVVQNTLGTVGSAVDKTFTLLDKFAKWSRIGRALQVLQTWMLLHNALMLSNDLKVTLVSIVQNGYNFFQIKDEEGNIIDVNQQLNQTIVGLIDGVIGTEARIDLTIAFKKANRIYQAAANVMYAVTAIVDITRTIAELGAERIGKVANALRAWGVVSDRAYGYMSEVVNPGTSTQEKINNLYSKTEPFQNALNTVEIVSGVPQQTVDAFTGLATAEKELELARQGRDASGELIEAQVKAANKSPEIDDPVTVGRPE